MPTDLESQTAPPVADEQVLHRRVAELVQQLAERDRLVTAKDRQLAEMHNSLSWRITAPLRRAYDILLLRRNAPRLGAAAPIDTTQFAASLDIFPADFAKGAPLAFADCQRPLVSIIIPVFNQFGHTYSCLSSILANTPGIDYEVIIADDESQDETATLSRYAGNVRHIRNSENLGFLRNCNSAAAQAKGKYLVFLNNDTNVQKDWLKHLIESMEADPAVGMAGSRLVYPDGRLQEAGGIIWNDASGLNYGRLDHPCKPEYNYAREVDYISGASIMIVRELWEQAGGFDPRFAPAYYEDTDLAFTVRKLGFRVVYQPESLVVHFEGISHGTDLDCGIKSYQKRNQALFLEKWQEVLAKDHHAPDEELFLARDRSRSRKTLLFIDYQVPLFDKFAGSRTNYMYLRLLAGMGLNVKFIGADFLRIEPYSAELNRLGIETLDGAWYRDNWKQWIIDNGEHIDYVLFNKPDPAKQFLDAVKKHSRAKVLYQGHDLHYLRLRRKYEIEGDKASLAESGKYERMEKEIFRNSDVILTFSSFEEDVIRSIVPHKYVATVPLYFYTEFRPVDSDFASRKNILFVGGFAHTPNVDAVRWFSENVLPQVLEALPDLVFHVIGSTPPEEIRRLESARIRVLGFVSDEKLAEYYRSCRLAVIPLRFGAGVKGKTIEALYHGLPIVTTSIGVEGIPGIEDIVTAADSAEAFAGQVIELYGDPEKLGEAGRRNSEFARDRFSAEHAQAIMEKLLALEPKRKQE